MSAPKRSPGLGKGIGVLMGIPEEEGRYADDRPADLLFAGRGSIDRGEIVPGLRLQELPVDAVAPNSRQPRQVFDDEELQELAASIREHGVLQPIVVRPAPVRGPQPGAAAAYELIMGERRLRASRIAGRRTVLALVKDADDEQSLTEALLENLQRSALNPIEEASAYRQLVDDFRITHERLGERVHKSKQAVSNTLRLLRLPLGIQQKVAAGVISAGHARAVLAVVDPEAMEVITDRIVAEELSVRQAEALAARMAGPDRRRNPRRPIEQLDEVAERLGGRFDTRVRVNLRADRGSIVIDFATVRDLNRILEQLGDEGYDDGRRAD